jgi:hypothetical protein
MLPSIKPRIKRERERERDVLTETMDTVNEKNESAYCVEIFTARFAHMQTKLDYFLQLANGKLTEL